VEDAAESIASSYVELDERIGPDRTGRVIPVAQIPEVVVDQDEPAGPRPD
jgi:hypothetical protein